MGAGSVGLSRTAVSLALAGGLAVVGGGSAIVLSQHQRSEHLASVKRAQSTLSQSFALRINRMATRAEQYEGELRRLGSVRPESLLVGAPRTDFPTFAVAGTTLPIAPVAGADLPAGLTGPTQIDLEDAAVSARDSGQPRAVVETVGSTGYLAVLWPMYRAGAEVSTQSRRANATGWVVGVTSVDDFFAPLAGGGLGVGATTSLAVTRAGPAPPAAAARTGMVAKVDSVPSVSRLGVLLILLLSALATTGALVLAWLIRRWERDTQRERVARDAQYQLVSDISVTIQESLDIGVVLPAVLSQTSDRLRLNWIRIVTGPSVDGVELLSLGRRPIQLPIQRGAGDASTAAPGALVRVPLRRATRTLGHLEVVAPGGLDVEQLTNLRQCADLLAGALHNAELYEREQESVRRLRELDALKDDFLGTVSHELRTPLSVLVGYISLLNKSWDAIQDDARRSAVAMMEPNVVSLTHLVNDLLDFISDRRATTAATLVEVPLHERVAALAEQVRPLINRQHLEIVAPDAVEAWTDLRGLERIVSNLVGNAGKYSPEGTTIRVEVRQGLDDAVVSVADEGPGIRPEDQERIFERFYRGDSQAARSTRGTGIGLAVTLAWVQAIGARLEIRTGIGRGTTMTIRFPRNQDVVIDGAGTVTWQNVGAAEEELVR